MLLDTSTMRAEYPTQRLVGMLRRAMGHRVSMGAKNNAARAAHQTSIT